jgi:hypothetical protein
MALSPALEVALLASASLLAGTVDAIAGGGGLITLPALLAVGLPPHLALGTNKGQSVAGSFAAMIRFARADLVDRRRAKLTFPLGLAGSFAGAALVLWVRPDVLRPLVLVLLVGAAAYILLWRPRPPAHPGARVESGRPLLAAALALGLGAYDGFCGPGTGTFLIIAFVALLGDTPQRASASAKVVNFASNLAALALFAWKGTVLWWLALPMAAGQLVGGWIGAHLAVRGGDAVVRRVVLVVVAGLVAKLAFDLCG